MKIGNQNALKTTFKCGHPKIPSNSNSQGISKSTGRKYVCCKQCYQLKYNEPKKKSAKLARAETKRVKQLAAFDYLKMPLIA